MDSIGNSIRIRVMTPVRNITNGHFGDHQFFGSFIGTVLGDIARKRGMNDYSVMVIHNLPPS